jgi:hypothetical protein
VLAKGRLLVTNELSPDSKISRTSPGPASPISLLSRTRSSGEHSEWLGKSRNRGSGLIGEVDKVEALRRAVSPN